MRILTAIIFTLTYIGSSLSYGGQKCSLLFGAEEPVVIAGLLPAPTPKPPKPIIEITKVESESKRVELKKHTGSEVPEKLVIEEMKFSEKPEEASIELMRMLLQNSSYVLEEKNVLTKGELSIGIPVREGYYFEVTYKSMSSERGQFIVDKITYRTPTGSGSKKVAEGFLKADQFKIKKAEHEIGDLIGEGINAKIKIPLVIDGPLLTKIDGLAKFFEFFRKDELRTLLQTNSMFKIRTVFEYRRAKSVFFKVLFKEPFKAAIGLGFVALIAGNPMTIINGGKQEPIGSHIATTVVTREYGFVGDSINHMEIPPGAAQLRAEVAELNKQAISHFNSKEPYTGPNLSEIFVGPNGGSFTAKQNTWVFEKTDSFNNSTHTYIVFAEAKTSNAGPGLQYVVMEVNASKYPELIKFIKAQQNIPTIQPAQKVR